MDPRLAELRKDARVVELLAEDRTVAVSITANLLNACAVG